MTECVPYIKQISILLTAGALGGECLAHYFTDAWLGDPTVILHRTRFVPERKHLIVSVKWNTGLYKIGFN